MWCDVPRFLMGLAVAIIAAGVAAYFVVREGVVPINAYGRPLPLEPWAAATALDAALAREAPTGPTGFADRRQLDRRDHSLGKALRDLPRNRERRRIDKGAG
jgi:hypothetical protein